ncbi:MAG: pyridoxal phosphate-dependent aminotransferase, partial [Dehalococcoidales bacterium]
ERITMKLCEKIASLGTETAFQTLAKAQALEAKGVKVFHLEIGEPDFDTPQNIRNSAIFALENGYTNYCNSQGLPELRCEIAAQIERTRHVSVDPDCVIITPGAKPIMFYTMLALLEDGDEAIFPDPGFPIYESVINYTGAKPVPIPLREELDFRLDVEELESKITPHTKLIILNSPHNPTGGVLTVNDIRFIADLAHKHDITIISDEIYHHITYEEESYSITSLPGMLERTILIDGFSKAYAMTGWRLGYGIVPPYLVDPIVRLIINSVSCTPAFIQQAGIEALTGPQDSLGRMVNEFRSRRDFIVERLNEIPGFSCRKPNGAFYVFPNIKEFDMDSQKLADYFLNVAGVATLAGASFGTFGEGYLRLSYATSKENIKAALEMLNKAAVDLLN